MDYQLVEVPEAGLDLEADLLNVVHSYISPDRSNELVERLLI